MRSKVQSADGVQVQAAAAVRDGTADRLMKSLARLGSGGRHAQNCERDMYRLALREGLMVDLNVYYIWVHMKRPDLPDANHAVRHPMLLPHEMFHLLHTSGILLDVFAQMA